MYTVFLTRFKISRVGNVLNASFGAPVCLRGDEKAATVGQGGGGCRGVSQGKDWVSAIQAHTPQCKAGVRNTVRTRRFPCQGMGSTPGRRTKTWQGAQYGKERKEGGRGEDGEGSRRRGVAGRRRGGTLLPSLHPHPPSVPSP